MHHLIAPEHGECVRLGWDDDNALVLAEDAQLTTLARFPVWVQVVHHGHFALIRQPRVVTMLGVLGAFSKTHGELGAVRTAVHLEVREEVVQHNRRLQYNATRVVQDRRGELPLVAVELSREHAWLDHLVALLVRRLAGEHVSFLIQSLRFLAHGRRDIGASEAIYDTEAVALEAVADLVAHSVFREQRHHRDVSIVGHTAPRHRCWPHGCRHRRCAAHSQPHHHHPVRSSWYHSLTTLSCILPVSIPVYQNHQDPTVTSTTIPVSHISRRAAPPDN